MNLLYLQPGVVGGSEIYVRALLRALAPLSKEPVRLYGWESFAADASGLPNCEFLPVLRGPFRQSRRLYGENVLLRGALRIRPVDVLFSPANFAAPLLPGTIAQVATVHDLQHRWFPRNFSAVQLISREVLLRATLARCKGVIAISRFTATDLASRYRVPSERITVIPEGVGTEVAPHASLATPAVKWPRYLYFPAMLAPHKNHSTLLRAFALARRRGSEDLHLVLTGAGRDGRRWSELAREIEHLGLTDQVHHLGFVSAAAVDDLIRRAVALVYPSRFEGFGLPILEAMARGTPVIASNATSIPEVAGDAALLVDPEDVARWSEAITRIVTDAALRSSLAARGRAQVERFSWSRCAAATWDVLVRAAG